MCVIICVRWCLWLCPVLASVFCDCPQEPLLPPLPPAPATLKPWYCSTLLELGWAQFKMFLCYLRCNLCSRQGVYTFLSAWLWTRIVTVLQSWFSAHCLLLPDVPVWCDSHIRLVVSNVWQGIRKIKAYVFMELKLSSLRSPFNGLYCLFYGSSEENRGSRHSNGEWVTIPLWMN